MEISNRITEELSQIQNDFENIQKRCLELASSPTSENNSKKLQIQNQFENLLLKIQDIIKLEELFKDYNKKLIKVLELIDDDQNNLLGPLAELIKVIRDIHSSVQQIFPDLQDNIILLQRAEEYFSKIYEYIRTGYSGYESQAIKIGKKATRAGKARLQLALYVNPDDPEARERLNMLSMPSDQMSAALISKLKGNQ